MSPEPSTQKGKNFNTINFENIQDELNFARVLQNERMMGGDLPREDRIALKNQNRKRTRSTFSQYYLNTRTKEVTGLKREQIKKSQGEFVVAHDLMSQGNHTLADSDHIFVDE